MKVKRVVAADCSPFPQMQFDCRKDPKAGAGKVT